MHLTSFTRNFLLMFSGPLIWALHFLFIYGLTGIVCARPAMAAQSTALLAWSIGLATLLAILSIGAIVAIQVSAKRHPPQTTGDPVFIRWTAVALGALSSIAIIWETLPVFLIPACN